jgi:hypothetical protein
MVSMTFARRVFFIAGIYGVLVLAPQYFLEARIGRDSPPPITHPEHFYGFIGVALAWQVLFFVIARDPVRFRAAMLPAILEKVAFGIAAIVLFAQGRLAAAVVPFAGIDLLLATLFGIAMSLTPRIAYSAHAASVSASRDAG